MGAKWYCRLTGKAFFRWLPHRPRNFWWNFLHFFLPGFPDKVRGELNWTLDIFGGENLLKGERLLVNEQILHIQYCLRAKLIYEMAMPRTSSNSTVISCERKHEWYFANKRYTVWSAKHGGDHFSTVSGSLKDPIAVPGQPEVTRV